MSMHQFSLLHTIYQRGFERGDIKMEFTHDYKDRYGYCKECHKQKPFCTCSASSGDEDNSVYQKISENHPCQSQSIGEEEQQQKQEQGGLKQSQGSQTQGPQSQEQTQGPEDQDQFQEGQKQSQSQEQTGGTQGSPVQNQTQDQDQVQTGQEQTQGPQLQLQRHGDQTLTSTPTISTPVDVDVKGVTVNVKCGDCKPIIVEKKKKRNHCDCECDDLDNCDCGCDDMNNCDCRQNKVDQCRQDNCCVQSLSDLLNSIRSEQLTATTDVPNPIDIYLSVTTSLANPIVGQVISSVNNCVVRFRPATQTPIFPSTTVQLCDVAGICSTTQTMANFLIEQANATPEESNNKKKKRNCCCPCCATGIGEDLQCAANFGLPVTVNIQGVTTALGPFNVLNVKDCLAYFVNSTVPTQVCVFSLCAIVGFTPSI